MSLEHLKPYQFKPGQSGNPSGRPKRYDCSKEIEALLKGEDCGVEVGKKLMKHLVKFAMSGRRGSMQAMSMILDRMEGKPQEFVNVEMSNNPLYGLSKGELEERLAKLRELDSEANRGSAGGDEPSGSDT